MIDEDDVDEFTEEDVEKIINEIELNKDNVEKLHIETVVSRLSSGITHNKPSTTFNPSPPPPTKRRPCCNQTTPLKQKMREDLMRRLSQARKSTRHPISNIK